MSSLEQREKGIGTEEKSKQEEGRTKALVRVGLKV